MKFSSNFCSTSGLRRTLVTWVTAVAFTFQTILPSYAAVMSDAVIENDLASNPVFQQDTTGLFNYIASSYINAHAPAGAQNMAGFYQQVTKDYRFAVDAFIVPIGVGDMTIFIDAFEHYKSVGDDLVQSRYVRAQIKSMLGRNLINSDVAAYQTEAAQINTLYNNALSYINSNPAIHFGDKLNKDQDNSGFAKDMIWPELRTIQGKQVLVPIVYLTQATVDAYKVQDNSTHFNGVTQFSDLVIEGSTIQLGRDAFLSVVNSLLINGGELIGSGNLTIRVGGEVRNLSGLIQAQGDLVIGAKSILSETIVHRYDFGGGNTGGYFGEIASINAVDGSVVLRAYEDILLAGTAVSAGQDIRFAADGNIYVGTVQIASSYNGEAGWRTSQGSAIEYLGSKLTAEESIELIANGNVLIDASEIVAGNGHIEILAGLGITIEDELNQSQSYKKGKFGKTKKEISTYKTVAMRSLLDAGKDIRIHSEFGDITLKAVDITSADGASVTAANGKINLLVTKETDHYSYSSVKKKLFTTKTVSKGHEIEAVVPNTIVGGFKADALYGLNVEYEGDKTLTLQEQVAELSKFEGLEWMATVQQDYPEAQWTEIQAKYEVWKESNTSLSAGAMALITVIVAVVTAGAGAAMIGAAGTTAAGTTTALGAMMNAGFTAMVSSATIASANATVNGGSIGDVLESGFEAVHSEEGIKKVAIAMVTAGAMAQLDAEFFLATSDGVSADSILWEEGLNGLKLSLQGQAVQALTHASVEATAGFVINGGNLDSLGNSFIKSFARNSLNNLGENLANKIGEAKYNGEISTAIQYVSHAAVGCLTGAATATLDDGETSLGCSSGAGGAVIGEFIGQAYQDDLKEDLDVWITDRTSAGDTLTQEQILAQAMVFKSRGVNMARLAAGLAAFAVGGDVSIAANSGANAADNNALFILTIVAATAAYTAYVSYLEGGLYEGLQSLGRGDDPLATAISETTGEAISWLASEYPDKTKQVAAVLNAVGEEVAAGVRVVMEAEGGKVVTRYWNEIPQEKRDAIVGGLQVATVIVPGAVIAKLKVLKNVDADIDVEALVKDRDHLDWQDLSESDRDILLSEDVYETEIPDVSINVGLFDQYQDRIDNLPNVPNKNKEIGEIGEEIAKDVLRDSGYDMVDLVRIENASGNGIDILAKSADGVWSFFEVKTSNTGNIGNLSDLQKNSDTYIRTLLDEGGSGRIRNQAISEELADKIDDIRSEVLSSNTPIRATAIGVDLKNKGVFVSPW